MKKKQSYSTWVVTAFVGIVMVAVIYFVWTALSDNAPGKKKPSFTMIKVVKPPEPPPIKEKLPEPQEIKQQKQEIIAEAPQDQPKGPEQDNAPAGDKLGLDAEGTAGGDSFGLAARKGGRSILARSGGGSKPTVKVPLMVRFAGYIKIVTAEIKEKVIKRLDAEGGMP